MRHKLVRVIPQLSGQGETHWRTQMGGKGFKLPLNLRIFLSCVFVQKYCPSCAPVLMKSQKCTGKR